MRFVVGQQRSMGDVDTIDVTVVMAWPARVERIELQVPAGTTIGEAVARSGITADTAALEVGVFGERRRSHDLVRAGDRIEIYRPLQDDPKAIRRRRAAMHRESGE